MRVGAYEVARAWVAGGQRFDDDLRCAPGWQAAHSGPCGGRLGLGDLGGVALPVGRGELRDQFVPSESCRHGLLRPEAKTAWSPPDQEECSYRHSFDTCPAGSARPGWLRGGAGLPGDICRRCARPGLEWSCCSAPGVLMPSGAVRGWGAAFRCVYMRSAGIMP